MPPTDDLRLLLATRRGHEPSARELWRRHAPRLLAHAQAILRDRAASDDVVQSVMCRILELPAGRVKAIGDPAAFLAAATRREALNYLRAARRESARRANAATAAAPVTGAPDAAPRDELASALDRLPRRCREILILKHTSGLTFDQIALALCTNRNTIAARYRAAITQLRAVIDPSAFPGVAHV